jgi:hypothetical protein
MEVNMEFCKYNLSVVAAANKHEFIMNKINETGGDDSEKLRLCENRRYLYELIEVYGNVTETCKTCKNEECAWNKGNFEVLRSKCDDIMNNIKEMLDTMNDMVEEMS